MINGGREAEREGTCVTYRRGWERGKNAEWEGMQNIWEVNEGEWSERKSRIGMRNKVGYG